MNNKSNPIIINVICKFRIKKLKIYIRILKFGFNKVRNNETFQSNLVSIQNHDSFGNITHRKKNSTSTFLKFINNQYKNYLKILRC